MSKIGDVKSILQILQVPPNQQSDLCCLVLLAMASIKEKNSWKQVQNNWIRIHDVIQFIKENYNVTYAENSRGNYKKTSDA